MAHADLVEAWFSPGRWCSTEPTLGVGLRWHEHFELMQQGVSWHGAGLHSTPDQHAALAIAERAVYPDGRTMTEMRTWQMTDPDVVIMEWRDQGTLWNGQSTHNGGLTLFEFEDGAVRRMSNYTNTAYLQAVERGWHELLRRDTLLRLPAFHTLEMPDSGWKAHRPATAARMEEQPSGVDLVEEPLTAQDRVLLAFAPHRDRRSDAIVRPPGSFWEFQGTRWHLAGRNVMQDWDHFAKIIGAATAKTFVGGYFTHLATWGSTDPHWAFMEWTSDASLYTNTGFCSQGLTALRFDDEGQNTEHREYLNVAYLEAKWGDWRQAVPADVFDQLACAKTYDDPPESWTPLPIES
jgi:hypothetical protein